MNTLVLKRTPWERFKKGLFKYWEYYLMLIPGFALLIIFSYAPMYGILLAFKNLRMKKGIWGSPWANPWYLHFKTFFDSPYAYRLLRNTLIISITKVVLAKLAAVGLALLLNECRTSWYRRMVQTVSYMPHFLSWVVVYGITYLLCSESSGYINRVLRYFDSPTVSILTSNLAFRPMLYITHIWKGTGFSSIIYLATMTSIDPTLYEAAQVDGAGRLQRIWHITLPGIRSTFVMLCIISAGSIMNAGFDQVYVFYNELVYESGDIIDTYVYRVGLEDMRFGLSTAVGLFKNVIGFILVFSTNKIAQHWGGGDLVMSEKRRRLSATTGEKVFDVFVYAILGLCFLLWFFPLIYVLLASFTPYKDVVKGSLLIIPSSFTLTGYEYIFNSTNIFKSFGNTLFITVVGTSLSMTVTILLAFPLSRKDLPGRSVLLKLLVFTMYFSGGLIPTYMVVRNLKLVNTIWAMIIPGALSVYNMLLVKSYFESMPDGLMDAAIIDGCGPLRTLVQIVLPLSLPVLMSVTLFFMVDYWNSYYSYVYYCYDPDLRPLQVVLREIIKKATGDAEAEEYVPTITVQMSAIVFACIPIICVYPFLQKYFTKGVMLGAIKG